MLLKPWQCETPGLYLDTFSILGVGSQEGNSSPAILRPLVDDHGVNSSSVTAS